VKALGAEPVLCTFSTSFSPTASAPVPPDVVLFAHRWNEHLSPRGWLAAVEQLNGVIRDVAEQEGALLVDTAAVLAGREEKFRDPVHFTADGHTVLAETIAAALSRTMARKQEMRR
jgi:lysophospholipase L1-like esterase